MSDFSNLHVGDKIEFDNGLVHAVATITKVADKSAFVGEKRRYVVQTEKGNQSIVSPSEVHRILEN